MTNDIFKFKKIDFSKLLNFGFVFDGENYIYNTKLNNNLTLTVIIDKNGTINTKVFDDEINEEYVLYRLEDAQGEFVNNVRQEIDDFLNVISNKCCEDEIFKSEQTKEVIKHIEQMYGDKIEYLWPKFPNNGIFRNKDSQKWYCAILTANGKNFNLEGTEIEVIDLRIDKEELNKIVDNQKFFRGYHMNKNSWLTICLNRSVPSQIIYEYLDKSYKLSGNKKTTN